MTGRPRAVLAGDLGQASPYTPAQLCTLLFGTDPAVALIRELTATHLPAVAPSGPSTSAPTTVEPVIPEASASASAASPWPWRTCSVPGCGALDVRDPQGGTWPTCSVLPLCAMHAVPLCAPHAATAAATLPVDVLARHKRADRQGL